MSKATIEDQKKRQLHYSVQQIFPPSKGIEISSQVHLCNHSSFWYSAGFLTVEWSQKGFPKLEFPQSCSGEELINNKAPPKN